MSKVAESLKNVRGFTKIQLVDAKTGKVQGDSGWVGPNQVVNLGFQDYVVGGIGAVAGSKQVVYMGIGIGSVPGAAATDLDGETLPRVTTDNSAVASKTLQCTCQFAGSDMTQTITIQNVGLFDASSGGTLVCGNTYATSQWASNQNVNATYQLRFS